MAKCAARKDEELIGRAATYRIEADALRERAMAVRDALIRDQYLGMAERWSTIAAHLEVEAMVKLLAQTTLL